MNGWVPKLAKVIIIGTIALMGLYLIGFLFVVALAMFGVLG